MFEIEWIVFFKNFIDADDTYISKRVNLYVDIFNDFMTNKTEYLCLDLFFIERNQKNS